MQMQQTLTNSQAEMLRARTPEGVANSLRVRVQLAADKASKDTVDLCRETYALGDVESLRRKPTLSLSRGRKAHAGRGSTHLTAPKW